VHLLRQLVDQCWDRVNPAIEDGDLEARAGPFNWLGYEDKGARFPTTLRRVPLLLDEKPGQREKARIYGWLEWRQSQEGKGEVSRDAIDKAIMATPREHCQMIEEDLNQSVEEVKQLLQVLNAKMGSTAPGLVDFRQALEDNRKLVQQIMQQKGGGDLEDGGGESESGDGAGGGAPTRGGSRTEAYRQLAQAAALLRQLEPHSPIPYLVQRAVELGSMPFPQLIRALIREPNILSELNRELGIKQEEAPAPPSG